MHSLNTFLLRLKEKLLRGKSKFDSTYRRKGFYSWYGSIETTQPNQNTSSSGYSSKTDHGNDLTQSTSSESTSQEGQNTPDDLHNVIDIRRRKKKKNCCCACVETVFPVEGEKRGRKKRRLLHWSLFKDFPFLVLCVSMAFFNLAQKTVFTFLPAIAEQKGISAYSVMLSVAGAGGTVGRVAAGFFMDRPRIKPHKCAVYSLILFFAAGAALMVPFSDSLLMLCVPCTLYGFMVGASVSQKSNVLAALLGKETVNSAFGILYSFQGLGTLAGPPLSGRVTDFSSLTIVLVVFRPKKFLFPSLGNLTYLIYSSRFLGDYMAVIRLHNCMRFFQVLLISSLFIPAAFNSSSLLLRQVCFGRRSVRFLPLRFQS